MATSDAPTNTWKSLDESGGWLPEPMIASSRALDKLFPLPPSTEMIVCVPRHVVGLQNLPNIDVWCTICMTPYWSSHRTTKVRVEGEQTGRTIAEVNPGYSQDSLLICDIRGGVHHLFVLWVGWISDQTRTHATNASQLREGWLGEVFRPTEHTALGITFCPL